MRLRGGKEAERGATTAMVSIRKQYLALPRTGVDLPTDAKGVASESRPETRRRLELQGRGEDNAGGQEEHLNSESNAIRCSQEKQMKMEPVIDFIFIFGLITLRPYYP